MGNDALLHKLQEENDKLKEKLQSWIDADRLEKVPTYIEDRDLRNEKTGYKLDKEQYKHTIDILKADLDDEKKFNEWLKYFSGYIYREDKDMYDKASNAAYELLTINIKGEEGDDRRKEILEQESKRSTGRKKDSESRVDE